MRPPRQNLNDGFVENIQIHQLKKKEKDNRVNFRQKIKKKFRMLQSHNSAQEKKME